MRLLLATCALALLPVAALAMCETDRHAQVSCADGKVWDEATKSCIVASS